MGTKPEIFIFELIILEMGHHGQSYKSTIHGVSLLQINWRCESPGMKS